MVDGCEPISDGLGPSGFDPARCSDCGGPQPVWFAPDEVWNLVMGGPSATGDPGGYSCPTCFIQAAEAAGVAPIRWEVKPHFDRPSLSDKLAEFESRILTNSAPLYEEMRRLEGELFNVRKAKRAAIAMEARSGETERLDPKDDSAGRKASPKTSSGASHDPTK